MFQIWKSLLHVKNVIDNDNDDDMKQVLFAFQKQIAFFISIAMFALKK